MNTNVYDSLPANRHKMDAEWKLTMITTKKLIKNSLFVCDFETKWEKELDQPVTCDDDYILNMALLHVSILCTWQ